MCQAAPPASAFQFRAQAVHLCSSLCIWLSGLSQLFRLKIYILGTSLLQEKFSEPHHENWQLSITLKHDGSTKPPYSGLVAGMQKQERMVALIMPLVLGALQTMLHHTDGDVHLSSRRWKP